MRNSYVGIVALVTLAAACGDVERDISAPGIPNHPLAASGKSGTTLAAYKTLDVCSNGDGTYTFSGAVSVWNEGAVPTVGLHIKDVIQTKLGTGQFVDYLTVLDFDPSTQIAAGTTQATATTFPYSVVGAPVVGATYRNSAVVTILNHSGSAGRPTGPNPKATFLGEVAACPVDVGCVRGQGFWGDSQEAVWPSGFDRAASFFNSGKTWQEIMDMSAAGGNAYVMLAHQYVAAVLNEATGADVPTGIQTTISSAETYFGGFGAGVYTDNSGTAKAWAGVLELYNSGTYPGGPSSCP